MPNSGTPASAASRSQAALRSLHSWRSVTIAPEPVTITPAKPSLGGNASPRSTLATIASSRSRPAATRIQCGNEPCRFIEATGCPVSRIRNGALKNGRSKALAFKSGESLENRVKKTGAPILARFSERAASAPARAQRTPTHVRSHHLPDPHPTPQRLLGGTGVRAHPAARPRSRRRHVPPGHVPACSRPRAVECRLRAALPASRRRPLRREPQPPAALLPVPGGDEAESAEHPGALPGFAGRAGHRPAGARPALRRGQLGIADARRLGPGLGSLAQRHGSHAVHLLPAGRWPGVPPGARRDHLRPRAPGDVHPERRQRVRPGVDDRAAGTGVLPRRVPPERSGAVGLQLRTRRRRRTVPSLRCVRSRSDEARRTRPAAAGLRPGLQGLAFVQPARCAPRDFGDRTPALHPARAQARPGGGGGLSRAARETGLPRPEARADHGGRVVMEPLLIELGTEELPVKALPGLAQALFDNLIDGLARRGIAFDRGEAKPLYSPRRLAVLLPGVAVEQHEQRSEVLGPYLNVALDGDGQPTRALQGFAQKAGVEWTALERTSDAKGERFVHRAVKPGAKTATLLPELVREAIAAMPIPKPMRWGAHEHAFARPVHWLVLLLGAVVIEGDVLGVRAGRNSRGHRFMHDKPVWIHAPGDYVDALRGAKVLVDPAESSETIVREVQAAATQAGGVARVADDNLAQVTCLVEWPSAIVGSFDADFLAVPQEALIATMEDNQKFFPVLGAQGKLTPAF